MQTDCPERLEVLQHMQSDLSSYENRLLQDMQTDCPARLEVLQDMQTWRLKPSRQKAKQVEALLSRGWRSLRGMLHPRTESQRRPWLALLPLGKAKGKEAKVLGHVGSGTRTAG